MAKLRGMVHLFQLDGLFTASIDDYQPEKSSEDSVAIINSSNKFWSPGKTHFCLLFFPQASYRMSQGSGPHVLNAGGPVYEHTLYRKSPYAQRHSYAIFLFSVPEAPPLAIVNLAQELRGEVGRPWR